MEDKDLIGCRIKARRTELEMTQGDIAHQIGVAISTVQRYEAGTISKIKLPVIDAIARALRVNPAWLVGKSETRELEPRWPRPATTEDIVTFPVLGDVAAGYNQVALETWSGDTVEIPRSYLNGREASDFFVLSVHGDSMYPQYQNGDKVLILRQDTLDHSGDVAVVLYDGDQATLKRVDYVAGEDWMRLVPVNPDYPPKTIAGADLEMCRIIGVPRVLIRALP